MNSVDRNNSSIAIIQGIGASPGFTLGIAHVLDHSRLSFPRYRLPNHEEMVREQMRLKTAIELSDHQLQEVKAKVARTEGGEHALILDAHRLMLKDPMFAEEARRLILEQHINAEWAVKQTVRKLKAAFEDIEDDYFRERRADIEFVGDRVVRNLLGQVVDLDPENGDNIPQGCILVAHDLSPADASVLLRRGQVAGFVTDQGGQTSHVSIVARARGIPGVVGANKARDTIQNGDLVAVDGHVGTVIVNPTTAQIEEYRQAIERAMVTEQAMLQTRDLPAITTDNQRMMLLGNLEFPQEEITSLFTHGAEGIGLYRTEFLFLERESPPTEEDHYLAYRAVLEAMGQRPVTIRTVDLGAEKVPRGPGAKKIEKEPNPALGLRAIRFCLKHRDVFMAQLRGIIRASIYGNLRVMFPMICDLSELREVKGLFEQAKEELSRAGIPFAAKIPLGIMIETPAATLAADQLAVESDFFSLGTNDLIQYSMAVDRQNNDVAYLYHPLHISILRQIKKTVQAAHQAGIKISMCGEMAGDPMFSIVLLGLGLDELSMVPLQIPPVKKILRSISAVESRLFVDKLFELGSATDIERYVRSEMLSRFGDLIS